MGEKAFSKKYWLVVLIVVVIITIMLYINSISVPLINNYDDIEKYDGEIVVIEAVFHYEAPDAFGNVSHFVLADGTEVALWDNDFSESDSPQANDGQVVRVVGTVWISIGSTETNPIISYPTIPCITDIEEWN